MQIRHDILKITGANNYCREPYRIKISRSAIEAFVNKQKIVCHHRNADPFTGFCTKDLKKMNMYYDRPADELKIISQSEHTTVHKTGIKFSDSHKEKLSNAKIGNTNALGHTGSKSWLGRTHTQSSRDKMKLHHVGTLGRHFYNNGCVTIAAFECPDGFVPGRLKRKK